MCAWCDRGACLVATWCAFVAYLVPTLMFKKESDLWMRFNGKTILQVTVYQPGVFCKSDGRYFVARLC